MKATGVGAIIGGCLVAATTAAAQPAESARADADAQKQRYQIGVLERVLESAVEHGLTVTRDRMQAAIQAPTDLLASDNAHARGFRLEGYGVFFDVSVPQFETTTWWTLRTLDQNDLGLDSAMKELQRVVKSSGNPDAEQALRRVELQVTPITTLGRSPLVDPTMTGARTAAGSTAAIAGDPTQQQANAILTDPNEAYRAEVIDALKEAMLDHSSSLGIAATEWLTVAARGNDDRPRLAPADSSSRTRIIRLRGSDLQAYLSGQLKKDEAKERIEVRVF